MSNPNRRRFLATLGAALTAAPAIRLAGAQANWPSQPVRFILPVAAGGTADATMRFIQEPLQRILGQQVIIDHRPGGAATIATDAVVRSKPDGHTFGLVSTPFASNPALLAKLPYDSEKDIAPVAFFWRARTAWSVHKSVPVHSLADIIAKSKAEPGSIAYATGGVGQASHFSVVLLEQAAGIRLTHAPYRGAGPAMNDAIAGHVPMVVSTTAAAAQHVESGVLRMIVVTAPERSTLFPKIPTVAESGFPGFHSSEWFGFVGPAGLPADIAEKMNKAIEQALQDRTVQEQFAKSDLATNPMTPAAFGEYLSVERKRMADIVKAANIKVQ